MYRVFVENKGIEVETIIECIDYFFFLKYKRAKRQDEEKLAIDLVTESFDKFLKLVTERTGKRFKQRPNKRRRSRSYEDWWQECNLDGSFAYSGVTDDF